MIAVYLNKRTLIIEAKQFGEKRRIVIDPNNQIRAERLDGGEWAKIPWLVDASDLIAVALRFMLSGSVCPEHVVETTDVVIIELGDLP